MSEVLPPKRQAVFDRLRRRIESYRRHQNDCIPRFDQSFNGVVEQNIQDTLVLKQRFLESKAKRAAKKSEKKPTSDSLQNNVHTLPNRGKLRIPKAELYGVMPKEPQKTDCDDGITCSKFSAKRSASEEGESGGAGDGYSGEPPPKQPPPKEGLTKFSVEIVQQLEFTTTSSNSQISTNVTVKALNTSVKSDLPRGSDSPKPATPADPDIVECKREPENPEFVDLEQCAAALEKDANGGNSFPGFSDLIGDDTSDAIITSDAFKDLISEISDFNPEFMRDFDFDGGEAKAQSQERQQFEAEEAERKVQPPPGAAPAGNRRAAFDSSELSPAAQTLKQMAEQHQHKTQSAIGFNPARAAPKSPYDFQFNGSNEFVSGGGGSQQQSFKQATPPCSFSADNVKQEVFSGSGYGKIPSPGARLGPGFKAQYPSYGSPQYTTRQPSSLQLSQAQQLQAQGQQIQVSMAQNMSVEVKGNGVSIAQQQGMYGGAQEGANYCNVSQSQTINFTQQSLRQRAQLRQPHQLIRNTHPGIDMMQTAQPRGQPSQQIGMRPAPPEYNKGQGMLHAMMSQRFPPQPRMLPLQPMPPSGPMMRAQQSQYIQGGTNINTQPRLPTFASRTRQSTPLADTEWRQMLLQQNRPQFHQAQGVNFATNNTQISAAQIQHVSRLAQHQSLAMHHSNPPMSVSLQMNQSMGSGAVYSSGASRQSVSQLPSYSAPIYSNPTVSSAYSTGYSQPQPTYQHQQQQNTIPPDFNLDFLEQLPTSDPGSFSEQELLSSLESGTSFNLQDIL